MIEVTAFKSTTVNDVEVSHITNKNYIFLNICSKLSTYDLGGIVQCMATREHIIYFMDVMREKSEEALQLFAAAILKPKYTEEEILMGREMMSFLQYELPSEMLIRDAIFMAAYKNSPLGLPYYNFSFESNANITKQKLDLFRSQFFRTGNFVLAGSGMSHTEFAAMANKAFSPYLNQDVVSDEAKKPLPLEDSVYVGGLYTETREMKEPFVKLAVAFEVGGWHSADLVTACVLQMFLGGGSSFSAGGPGKGMYSKLYTDVLNRYHWIESAQSFISVQNKVGLLGIDGSCEPADVQGLFRVLVDQLLQLSIHLIKPIELSRAKNMLKSSLMMQLESRIITCEDIAKQIGTYGIRESPESLCQKIDIVTAEDIRALVGKMTKNDVSVACMGSDTSQMPSYDVINEFTKRYKNELYKKYNFYPKDWS